MNILLGLGIPALVIVGVVLGYRAVNAYRRRTGFDRRNLW